MNGEVTVNVGDMYPTTVTVKSGPTSLDYPDVKFKFNEDIYLRDALNHIEKTYKQHYASKDGSQAIDAIFAAGHGIGFCMGNITKYTNRFGKKDGQNRVDLLKLIHYAVLALHALDLEAPTLDEFHA